MKDTFWFKGWVRMYVDAEKMMRIVRDSNERRLTEHDKEASRLYHNITVACANLREYLEERCDHR